MTISVGLYQVSDKEKLVEGLKRKSTSTVLERLKDYYLESGNKLQANRIDTWLNKVENEKLEVREPKLPTNLLEFSLKYNVIKKVPKTTGLAKEYASVNVLYHYLGWVRKESNLLSLISAKSRSLSNLSMKALSLLSLGSIDRISPIKIDKDIIESIELSEVLDKGSNIKRVTVKDVAWNGSSIDEISVKRRGLVEEEIYKKLKRRGRKIEAISVVIPTKGGKFSVRISRNGRVVIYSQISSYREIDPLISSLEGIIAPKPKL